MGYTYKGNEFEIRNTTNYHLPFYFAQLLWKKQSIYRWGSRQIEILKKNEENYKNVPDPVFSFDCGEGTITRKTITQYIKDCS